VEIARQGRPELATDGEMMADTALVPEIVEGLYPFSRVRDANVLVFPNLAAANVAYRLLQRLGNAEAIGSVLMGMNKPVHVLQRGDEVRDIINITALAVVDAQQQVEAGQRCPVFCGCSTYPCNG
jgi:malate dehydrogenase (oxaloacetate-decarboxylating)(NADP+)